ncbi:hypothetical protein K439DRAFT_1338410 [Ramaria rubella]|nr:hypothetical protein K439DRAFT_1338410 [Ramaria rubella]
MMKPWLHFTLGDNLFFMAWVPLSAGTVIGACIGLFLLAIVERWVSSMRAVMQVYWSRKTEEILATRFTKFPNDSSTSDKKRLSENSDDTEIESLSEQRPDGRSFTRISHLRRATPFIPAHDFTRGAIHACQAALNYTLMLAVMTFHAGYIIAIILGLGVGEVLFGRFGKGIVHH